MNNKVLAFAFILFFGVSEMFAQGRYTEFSIGYGYQLSPTEMDYNYNETLTDSGKSWDEEVVKGSFGQGVNAGVRFGYMFSPWMGVDFGVNYLMSGKMKATSSYTDNSTFSGYNSTSSNTVYTGRMLRLNPSFVMMQDNGTISPFARVGLVLGVGSVSVDYHESDSNGDSWSYRMVVNGGVAVGFSGDLGVKYLLSDHISFIGSLNLIGMSYSPKRGEVVSYIENGVEYVTSLTTYDREVEYMSSVSGNTAATTDPNQPYQDLKFYLPFSSIGLNVGLRIDL